MTSFARRTLLARAAMTVVVGSLGAGAAHAADTIKIGEINSYKNQPAFLEPYKRGMELAVDEVNKAGGVNGKKLELITRDDNANPGDTVRVAEELIAREKVDVLAGGFLSNTGMALTESASAMPWIVIGWPGGKQPEMGAVRLRLGQLLRRLLRPGGRGQILRRQRRGQSGVF